MQKPPTLTANAPGNTVLTATVAPVAPGNPAYASLPVAIGFTAAALPAAPGYGEEGDDVLLGEDAANDHKYQMTANAI